MGLGLIVTVVALNIIIEIVLLLLMVDSLQILMVLLAGLSEFCEQGGEGDAERLDLLLRVVIFLGRLGFVLDALGLAVLKVRECSFDLEGLTDDVLVLEEEVELQELLGVSLRDDMVRRLTPVQLY